LTKYNLDIVAVQEVRWVERGNQPADHVYTFLYGNGNANYKEQASSYIRKLQQHLKKVKFITGRMSYITLG